MSKKTRAACMSRQDQLADTPDQVYNSLAEMYDAMIPDPEGFSEFYVGVCGEASRRVLYVGCGTGRLLTKLIGMGHYCVGVDPSKRSIEIARRRIGLLEVAGHSGSRVMVDSLPSLVAVDEQFDIVMVAGGAFEHLLTTRDQVCAIRRLKEMLSMNGAIAIDVAAPPFTVSDITANYSGTFAVTPDIDIEFSEVRFGYDHFRQLVRSVCTFTVRDASTPITYSVVTRYTSISEWRLLLEACGLRGQFYGDFCKGPITRSSANYVILAKRGN